MSSYRIHDPDKGLIGPVRLETVSDLVAAGVVHDGTWVSRDDGPFLPIQAFQEIRLPAKTSAVTEPKPTFTGDFGQQSFFKIFYRFHATHSSGLLVIKQDQRRKDIFLEDGQPVFIASSEDGDRFGQFLLQRGCLDHEELQVALETMRSGRICLGHAVVKLGLLEESEVQSHLSDQQTNRLLDLFGWAAGRYLFYDGTEYLGERVQLQVNAANLITLAAGKIPTAHVEKSLQPLMDTALVKQAHPFVPVEQLPWTAHERRVAAAIDGIRTGRHVLRDYARTNEERGLVLTVLWVLWEIEAIAPKKT